MKSYLPQKGGTLSSLYGMLQYHLGWSDQNFKLLDKKTTGKRLRSTICLAACEDLGGKFHNALPAAAAIDDIEDRSFERRHKPSLWHIWGDALAINAGDALFSIAHLALLDLYNCDISLQNLNKIYYLFDKTCLTLCEGQHIDIAAEKNKDLLYNEYFEMIEKKTATLIATSASIGSLIAKEDENIAQSFYNFGLSLGIAFQIQDDILGIWGDPKITGKSTSDLYSGKLTLPSLILLDKIDIKDKHRLLNLFRNHPIYEKNVNWILNLLENNNIAKLTNIEVEKYYLKALEHLESTKTSSNQTYYLESIIEWLFSRQS